MPAKQKIDFKVKVFTSEGKMQTHQSLEYSHLMKQALDKTLDDMHSQIDLAIDKEDIEQLKQLLSMDSITLMAGAKIRINKGAPSNVIPISFDPVEVLSTAVVKSKPKVVDFLLKEYCKTSSKKKISENDLHSIFAMNAMSQKNMRILLSLIQHGANPNLSGTLNLVVGEGTKAKSEVIIEGSIALAYAIFQNNIPAIEFLLGRTTPRITTPVDLKKWRDNHYNSALQFAIKFCKETVASYFIDNKLVDLESVNLMGNTALLMTILGKQRHIFDKLKAAKASFHYLDDFKLNALEIMMNPTKFNTELLRPFLYNKINLWLADFKLTLTEQKKNQVNIITKIVIQKLLTFKDVIIDLTHGNINTEFTTTGVNFLPGQSIQMTETERREFNTLKQRKSFPIVLGKKELVEITQELLKEYQEDNLYLLEKCDQCIFKTSSGLAQYQKEFMEFIQKSVSKKDKTPKVEGCFSAYGPGAQRLLVDEIKTSVENALKPFSTGSESDIHKKIVKFLHENNFYKVKGQICFKGSPMMLPNIDNKDSSEQEYTLSNEKLLAAIKESYTIYKTNPNQDLDQLVLVTLVKNSNEFNALSQKMMDSLAEKFLDIKNNHSKNLSDFDKRLSDFNLSLGNAKFQIETLFSTLKKFEEQIISQMGTSTNFMDNKHLKNHTKILNELKKMESAQLINLLNDVESTKKDIHAVTSKINWILKYIHSILDTVDSIGSSINCVKTVNDETENNPFASDSTPGRSLDIAEQYSLIFEKSRIFHIDIAKLNEKINTFQEAVEKKKKEIKQYIDHYAQSLEKTLASAFNKVIEDYDAELQRKIKESAALAKLDALKDEQRKSKEEYIKKLQHAKLQALKEADLAEQNSKKQERLKQLQTAISAATEVEPLHKPSMLTVSSAADILPKVATFADLRLLKQVLDKVKSSFAQDKLTIEELIIQRSALLCLTARLMEGIKDFPSTILFTPAQAEKIRNTIFHYRDTILSESESTPMTEVRKMNESVIEMVHNIINFMENENAQKHCKGNWEKISAHIHSPLLNKILNASLTPRTDLNSVLKQLSLAERRLELFLKYLNSGQRKLDEELVKCAIYSAYAEVGAFAADYKQINRNMYDNVVIKLNKLYDIYIEYGNDVRHGRIPNVSLKPLASANAAAVDMTTDKARKPCQ